MKYLNTNIYLFNNNHNFQILFVIILENIILKKMKEILKQQVLKLE